MVEQDDIREGVIAELSEVVMSCHQSGAKWSYD